MKYNLKKIKSYKLELTVTLDKSDLDYYINEAQKHLTNDLKIKGFRPGKAPVKIAKDKLDKKQILDTAFDLAFKQSFAGIIMKEKPELIDAGSFEIKENSTEKLKYTILLTIFPEFELVDYKNIPVKRKNISVSEDEINYTLESIRKSKANNGITPELNDGFAKSLGHFNSLKELRDGVGDGLKQEKEIKESQRVQNFVLEKIAEKIRIEIPPVLIERQLNNMMIDLDADLHQQGMELSLFLAKIKKTQEQLKEEWRPKAEHLVKKALILKKIAKQENIRIEPEEVKNRVNELFQNFTNIEQAQKNIDLPKLTDQIQQVLLNQKVLKFLEKEAKYI